MPAKRMRADIWVNLQSRIESEIERTGLSVNEVVNMALADYFGLSPRGRVQAMAEPHVPLPVNLPQPQTVDDEEDYI